MSEKDINRAIDMSDVLNALEEVWRKHPHLRLGQLIQNALGTNADIFYITDRAMLDAFRKARSEWSK